MIDKHEDAKFIEDDPEFQKIAYKIKNSINSNLINQLKNKLESKKSNDSTKNQYSDYSISFFPLLSDNKMSTVSVFIFFPLK